MVPTGHRAFSATTLPGSLGSYQGRLARRGIIFGLETWSNNDQPNTTTSPGRGLACMRPCAVFGHSHPQHGHLLKCQRLFLFGGWGITHSGANTSQCDIAQGGQPSGTIQNPSRHHLPASVLPASQPTPHHGQFASAVHSLYLIIHGEGTGQLGRPRVLNLEEAGWRAGLFFASLPMVLGFARVWNE